MINLAIIDDEAKDRETLALYISRFFSKKKMEFRVWQFTDGADILKNYPKELDMILLDIQMEKMDGITTARKIRQFDSDVLILFTTNMIQYALKGYEVDALDFLVKPIKEPVLQKRMEKALSRLDRRAAKLVEIQSRKESRMLDAGKILYCETCNKRMLIHTAEETIWCTESMESLEKKLKPFHFYSCHRSFLVNLAYVDKVQQLSVMINQVEIPISKYRKKDFLNALVNYMGEQS